LPVLKERGFTCEEHTPSHKRNFEDTGLGNEFERTIQKQQSEDVLKEQSVFYEQHKITK